jgi:ectoine hydroxylase-related dioxygenase (phytanoyl-CoA dioxygenase family)
VPWHQDLTISVSAKLDVPEYGPWTKKAGVWHVQPPASVSERMLSVRIHLDDCSESNGALRVLPGTHRLGRLNAVQIAEQQRMSASVTCVVDVGGVLLMRPLLLHASSAASESIHRRVFILTMRLLNWRAACIGRPLSIRRRVDKVVEGGEQALTPLTDLDVVTYYRKPFGVIPGAETPVIGIQSESSARGTGTFLASAYYSILRRLSCVNRESHGP